MTLKEYFDMGRQQELDHEKKKQARVAVKVVRKPSAFSFAGVLIGAGVLYQIVSPYVNRTLEIVGVMYGKVLKPTADVVKVDVKMAGVWVKAKIMGINPEWEKFKQFDELARKR